MHRCSRGGRSRVLMHSTHVARSKTKPWGPRPRFCSAPTTLAGQVHLLSAQRARQPTTAAWAHTSAERKPASRACGSEPSSAHTTPSTSGGMAGGRKKEGEAGGSGAAQAVSCRGAGPPGQCSRWPLEAPDRACGVLAAGRLRPPPPPLTSAEPSAPSACRRTTSAPASPARPPSTTSTVSRAWRDGLTSSSCVLLPLLHTACRRRRLPTTPVSLCLCRRGGCDRAQARRQERQVALLRPLPRV